MELNVLVKYTCVSFFLSEVMRKDIMLVKQRYIVLFFITREQTEITESKGSQEIKELGYD